MAGIVRYWVGILLCTVLCFSGACVARAEDLGVLGHTVATRIDELQRSIDAERTQREAELRSKNMPPEELKECLQNVTLGITFNEPLSRRFWAADVAIRTFLVTAISKGRVLTEAQTLLPPTFRFVEYPKNFYGEECLLNPDGVKSKEDWAAPGNTVACYYRCFRTSSGSSLHFFQNSFRSTNPKQRRIVPTAFLVMAAGAAVHVEDIACREVPSTEISVKESWQAEPEVFLGFVETGAAWPVILTTAGSNGKWGCLTLYSFTFDPAKQSWVKENIFEPQGVGLIKYYEDAGILRFHGGGRREDLSGLWDCMIREDLLRKAQGEHIVDATVRLVKTWKRFDAETEQEREQRLKLDFPEALQANPIANTRIK